MKEIFSEKKKKEKERIKTQDSTGVTIIRSLNCVWGQTGRTISSAVPLEAVPEPITVFDPAACVGHACVYGNDTGQGIRTHHAYNIGAQHTDSLCARFSRKPGARPNLSVGQRRGHRTRSSVRVERVTLTTYRPLLTGCGWSWILYTLWSRKNAGKSVSIEFMSAVISQKKRRQLFLKLTSKGDCEIG